MLTRWLTNDWSPTTASLEIELFAKLWLRNTVSLIYTGIQNQNVDHFVNLIYIWAGTSVFEHRTNWNMFMYWWSNTLFSALKELTSNSKPNRAFTRFTKLLIELTRTSIFPTLNELERVHLMVIKLQHPILGFKRSNIELRI